MARRRNIIRGTYVLKDSSKNNWIIKSHQFLQFPKRNSPESLLQLITAGKLYPCLRKIYALIRNTYTPYIIKIREESTTNQQRVFNE